MDEPRDRPSTPQDPPVPSSGEHLTGRALGIDIGGTGIKAAVVDLATGQLVSDRVREKTPQPATPEAVAEVTAGVVQRLIEAGKLSSEMPAGAGFPAVIKHGRSMSAANVDKSWIDAPVQEILSARLGRPVLVLNDADAAGVAEMAHGAGRDQQGVVMLLTIGTGIGSALFVDGHLVPNTELGHLQFHGHDAETRLSGAARERRGLGWKRWAREFNEYLAMCERYFSPDLFILGGGVSKEMARFGDRLSARARIVQAAMLNTSGIVGAAMAGAHAARHAEALAHAAGGDTPAGDGRAPDRVRQARSRAGTA
jgi:polyphosphate glucokinase